MITTIYASILAVFYIALSVYIVKGRYQYRVSLGDGGNEDLSRRIRAHGNFAEYVPLALLLMLFAELEGASHYLLHALGLMILMGRVVHAVALMRPEKIKYGRQIGMGLTFTMITVCAVYGFIKALF